jgi:cell division protease FtsH
MWLNKKIHFLFLYSIFFLYKGNSFIPKKGIDTNYKELGTNSSFEFDTNQHPKYQNNERQFYLPLLSYNQKDNDRFKIEKNLNLNFTNIGGYESLKKELYQMKDMFLNNQKYIKYNIRVPKGILLEGPPGNGKTLMAKCFAGECGVSFISVSGSEFNEKYVGVGASRMRELFEKAKNNQPCIIFIDELDAIGSKRNDVTESSPDKFQTLNQLLVLLDGFSSSLDKIFVIGATNRKDILDKALIRSGRFDKIIHIPNPDAETRKQILYIHLYGKPIYIENIDDLILLTSGMCGSDIENLLNEVVLHGIRNDILPVNITMIDDMKEKVLYGYTSQKTPMNYLLSQRVSVHECGHLLTAVLSPFHEFPNKVSINSYNYESLGYTAFDVMDNERMLYNQSYIEDKVKVLLGGYNAEKLIFNDISSGAYDDLNRVKSIVEDMVIRYHMIPNGIFSVKSEKSKEIVDETINNIIFSMSQEVYDILNKHKNILQFCSKKLLKKKTLYKKDIELMITNTGLKK